MRFNVYLFIFILSLALAGCDGSMSVGAPGSGGNCSMITSKLDFGDVGIGEGSVKNVSLNCASGSVVQFRLLDETGGFSTVDKSPITAETDGAINIKIQFSPTKMGSANAVLRVAVGISFVDIEVKGNGVPSPSSAPTLSLWSVDFESVQAGTMKNVPITISNHTGNIFNITSIRVINETSLNVFSVSPNNCETSYPQGTNCQITASYGSSRGSKDKGRIEIKYEFVNENKPRSITIPLQATAY